MLDESTPLVGADNRGLRFGDGLFETLKFSGGKLILADEHLPRLWKGLKDLQFQLPALLTPERLEEETLKLLAKNKKHYARVRWTFFRGDGGLYDPINLYPHYIIQTWDIPNPASSLNSNGLRLCIYPDARKSCDRFANIKHNNYLPYVMGALYAREQHCNDALILNQYERICDSTIANLFLIRQHVLMTPALSEGCVAGIMRSFVLQACRKMGMETMENSITREMLLEADEVFLTNSIYNMRWVSHLGETTYNHRTTMEIYRQIQQTNPDVFC